MPRRSKRAAGPAPEQITGKCVGVRFHNASNAFSVLNIVIEGKKYGEDDMFDTCDCAIGPLAMPRQGDVYRFTGEWKDDAKWGRQFKFTQAELILPASQEGAARYLADTVYGVGPVKAEKIVAALGDNALAIIRDNPDALSGMEFLTDTQKEEIRTNLTANIVKSELAAMICRPGIGMGTVERIYAEYKDEAVAVIKENPYLLSEEVFGIGFRKADEIGLVTGIDPASPYRVRAAFLYTLREATNEGHCYLTPSKVAEGMIGHDGCVRGSGIGIPEIQTASELLMEQEHTIREGDCIYLKKLWQAERNTATYVRRILDGTPGAYEPYPAPVETLYEYIGGLEEKYGVAFADEQKAAIVGSAHHNMLILTGGPGTGKTTVINAICDLYDGLSEKRRRNPIYLAAPTGRASKRMSEATGRPASTIHRLLGYRPDSGFEVDALNPLSPGLLIVDEFSMCDIELASALFEAAKNCQVILVGDIDQLPSVGPGSVLRDLIASGVVPTVRLKYNYRQAGGSRIAAWASLFCQGSLPLEVSAKEPVRQVIGDIEFIPEDDAEAAADIVREEAMKAHKELGNVLKWQVLAPMKRGCAGVDALNTSLRDMVNPDNGQPERRGYRQGDKVMVIRNNYNLGVFNGDVGVVSRIGSSGIYVNFGDEEVFFADDDIGILVLAYAATIHKSQGSEYPTVIMPLIRQHYMMLTRQILYTGITRAKTKLVLVTDPWAIKHAAENGRVDERFSNLSARIKAPI